MFVPLFSLTAAIPAKNAEDAEPKAERTSFANDGGWLLSNDYHYDYFDNEWY